MIREVAAKGRDDGDHGVSIKQIALHGHERTAVVAGNVVLLRAKRLIVIAIAADRSGWCRDGDIGPWL